MQKQLFLQIADARNNCYSYFQMRSNASGRRGLSLLQKCTTVICILTYRSPIDSVDEYVRIGESTRVEWLEAFERVWTIYLETSIWEGLTTMTSITYYKFERHMGFQVCWVLLIAYIGNGKYYPVGKANIVEVIIKNPQ